MKTRLSILVVLINSIAALAHAAAMPPTPHRNFELMKCTSTLNGTIWASFGHMMMSGQDKVTYFPTEIVVFAKDLSSRLLFPDFNEALKLDVQVSPGRIHMGFSVPDGTNVRTHLIQVMQFDPRIDNAFIGNWTVSENGQDVMDQVACSCD